MSSLSSQTVHIVMHIRYPTIILNTLNIFPVTSIIPLKLVHPKILRSALNHHSFPLFTEGNHHPWGWYNLKIQNQFLFPFFFFFLPKPGRFHARNISSPIRAHVEKQQMGGGKNGWWKRAQRGAKGERWGKSESGN